MKPLRRVDVEKLPFNVDSPFRVCYHRRIKLEPVIFLKLLFSIPPGQKPPQIISSPNNPLHQIQRNIFNQIHFHQ
jgi:hypothetical protein